MEYSNLFVVVFGIGTVFIGLICIIILITLIGYFCNLPGRKQTALQAEMPQQIDRQTGQTGVDAENGKIAALLTAAAAEYVGVDVSKVKVIRVRRVGQ